MDYLGIPLFGLMKARLSYLSERQAAFAQNIANADTPGYRAKDIAQPDFKKIAKTLGAQSSQLQMTATNPKHMAGGIASPGLFKIADRPTTDEQKPDGNNVVLEEEMSKVAQNQMDYQKIVSMYGKTITMFKTAIGNTSGG